MRETLRRMLRLAVSISCLCCAIRPPTASATVLLKPSLISFNDLPAKFASDVDRFGICGRLDVADPQDGCSPMRNQVPASSNGTDQMRFALIVRGNCTFEDKILNAQNGGFDAVIVYDDRDRAGLVYMMVNPKDINVPAVFISKAAGLMLKEHAQNGTAECCIYGSHAERGWTVLAISLISMMVIFAFLALALFIPRQWLNWRGRANSLKNADDKIVAELPSFTFSSARRSNKYMREVCAVCLEDYKDGDILKALPCQHEFHSSCVDSWLKKGGMFCPVCKHDITNKSMCGEVQRGSRQ